MTNPTPLANLFQNLRKEGRRAFIPFVTAGDPDLDFTGQVIAELARRGASLCEIGIPYSDPIADGPVIQASYSRALRSHIRWEEICRCARDWADAVDLPLVSMVSYAIVLRKGVGTFVQEAADAGFAGMIVPDLLVEEGAPLREACREASVDLIQLVTPTTPRDRALRIAESSSGFLYYVSVKGITGERTELPADLRENLRWLRGKTDLPICLGFGIRSPEQIRSLRDVADGFIVGSALVRRLAEAGERPREAVIEEVGAFAESLARAAHGPV